VLTLELGSSDESGSGVSDEVAIAAAAGAADIKVAILKTSYTRSMIRKNDRTRVRYPMKEVVENLTVNLVGNTVF